MDYQRTYSAIIERARHRTLDSYSEKHHVLPRSMGGDDSADNLVELTAREHFICHWLLTKIHSTGRLHHKAIHAFAMMAWCSSENQERLRCNSRLYETLKREYSRVMSRSQAGEKNSQYGMRWAYNESLQESRRFPFDTSLSADWKWGRVQDWNKFEEAKKGIKCSGCGAEFKPRGRARYCSTKCRPQDHRSTLEARRSNPNTKECMVYEKKYPCVSEAADALGISHEAMRLRIVNPNNKDCYYIIGV